MIEKKMNIFIDTNIFKSCKYDLSEQSVLRILAKHVASERIKVYISDIVVNEVEKHIEEDIKKVLNSFRESRKEALKVINESIVAGTEAEKLFGLPDKQKIIECSQIKFRDFLKEIDATILDNTGVDLEKIVHDYFSMNPPFENSEKKKNEFPDAIFISKLKSVFSKEVPVVIISNDKGVQGSFDEDGFLCLNNLKELFDVINRQDKMYDLAINYVENAKVEIIKLIENEIESSEIEVDGLECDRKGICSGFEYEQSIIEDISNIDFTVGSVNDITEDYVLVTIECNADISVWCQFNDYEDSIWDPEEYEYMYLSTGEVNEEHKADFETTIKISIFESEKISFQVDSIACEMVLNSDSLVERKILESEDPRIMDEAEMMDALEEYYKH